MYIIAYVYEYNFQFTKYSYMKSPANHIYIYFLDIIYIQLFIISINYKY